MKGPLLRVSLSVGVLSSSGCSSEVASIYSNGLRSLGHKAKNSGYGYSTSRNLWCRAKGNTSSAASSPA